MRRGIGAIALIVVILAGVGIGAASYRAGERDGVAQGIEQVQVAQQNGQEVQVVHVVGEGRGFFFPGFFLLPLFLIGGIFLVKGIFMGVGRFGRGGPHGYGPGGPWNDEGRRRFEERANEWHQRQHGEVSPPEATPTA